MGRTSVPAHKPGPVTTNNQETAHMDERKRKKIKQKVISAKADKTISFASSSRTDGPAEAITLKEWQRLPKTLLQQFCDRRKVPKPEFQTYRRGGELYCKATLRVDKDSNKETHDCPVPGGSSQDASHRAALYALFQIDSSVPHYRVLPEPYRSLWTEWQASPPRPLAKSEREEPRPNDWICPGCGAHVYGSKKLCFRCETPKNDHLAQSAATIPSWESKDRSRGDHPRAGATRRTGNDQKKAELSLSSEGREAAHAAIAHARKDAQTNDATPNLKKESSDIDVNRLSMELRRLGFDQNSATRAATIVAREGNHSFNRSLRDRAIDMLCFELPEDCLPIAFQVKQRVQIVRPTRLHDENEDGMSPAPVEQLKRAKSTARERLRDLGFSAEEVNKATSSNECEMSTLTSLLQSLTNDATDKLRGKEEGVSSQSTDEEDAIDEVSMEFEALSAIYGDAFSKYDETLHTGRIIRLVLDLPTLLFPGRLEVLLPDCERMPRYPQVPALPVFFAENLPKHSRRPLLLALADEAARLAIERAPAIHELALWLEDSLERICSNTKVQIDDTMETHDVASAKSSSNHGTSNVSTKGKHSRSLADQTSKTCWTSPEYVRRINSELLAEQKILDTSESHADMRNKRRALPAHGAREAILISLKSSRVLVICGETGCGKSTQVPQFLLEEASLAGIGGEASIVVTQPRRIAAISLAERVAAERGGGRVGDIVGYAVRLDSRASGRTRLLYCTTGILLQRLRDDPALKSISYVVVDEVHERSLDSDFLLIVLRDALKANPKLRVILMSATLDADAFSRYFGNCSTINIPGRTYPIVDQTLEDVIAVTNYEVKGKVCADAELVEEEAIDELQDNKYSNLVRQSIRRIQPGSVPSELVSRLLNYFDERDSSSKRLKGAVLVFLPGIADIRRLSADLSRSYGSDQWLILPLHGELPAADQRRVFSPPPNGIRKILLATNIAETSLTIDDVTVVIDSGRVKQTEYDQFNAAGKLIETWTSLASRRQRRGRAGRTRPGEYWALYSQAQLCRLNATTAPEILRVPLHNLYLKVKEYALGGGDARAFLLRALQPPTEQALDTAVLTLRRVGALDSADNDSLTALGYHLARLPLDIRVAKIVIFGALLGCVDPALTIAATMSTDRSPFLSPFDQRQAADNAHKLFRTENSDQLALLRAYEGWRTVRANEGVAAARRWSELKFISYSGMEEVHRLRKQLSASLGSTGLPRSTLEAQEGDIGSQRKVHQVNLVRAILCAGLYPNVACVRMPKDKFVMTAQGSVETANEDARAIKYYLLPSDGEGYRRVFVHPSSALFNLTSMSQKHVLFYSKSMSSNVNSAGRMYLRDLTTVSPLALILFGGSVVVDHDRGTVTVDKKIVIESPGRVAVLVRELRGELDKLLERKIRDPCFEIAGHPVLKAIVQILREDRCT